MMMMMMTAGKINIETVTFKTKDMSQNFSSVLLDKIKYSSC